MRYVLVWLLLFCTPLLPGQSRTSAISGEVLDPVGGPIAGAVVKVRSVEQGSVRTTATDGSGTYLVAGLELGSYDVEVSHQGFVTSVSRGLLLTLQKEARLTHRLTVAQPGESLTVSASAVAVDSTSSALSGRVESRQILELPLIGRDYLQLALLQPGVHAARAQSQDGNGGFGLPLSITGSRPGQNSLRLDGVHLTNQAGSTPGSLLGINLGVDAIREFSVLSSSFGAATGRAAGGVVHAVTRSGGNAIHGGLFYFHRNSALDARNFFDRSATAAFRRHQFGGSLAGPVRRDRTFYFANAEGLRSFEARTTLNTTLSDAARAGNLSSGRVAIDPAIRPLLDLLPAPNAGVLGDTGLFSFPNPSRGREGFVTSRLDHTLGKSDTLFVRYTHDNAARSDLTNFALARRNDSTSMHSLAAEEAHLFSPRLFSTFRYGWLRSNMTIGGTRALEASLDNAALAFVPGAPGPGIVSVPEISQFDGGSGALDADQSRFDSHQFYGDFSLHHRAHLFRWGASTEATSFHFTSSNNPQGAFAFSTLAALFANTPLRFRAMLPGTDSTRLFHQGIFAWYFQDAWRVSRRLTLELSVRHEWITVPTEANGKLSNLDRLTDTVPRTSGPLFRNPSRANLAPRVGLAWNVLGDARTVFRAGYGLYHDQILSQYLLIAGVRNPPFFLYADASGLAAGGFPSRSYQELMTRPNIDLRMERLDPAPGQPRVRHWNASLQRALPASLNLHAAYAGSAGRDLSTIVEDANLVPFQKQADGRLFFPAGGTRINSAFGLIRNRLFNGRSSYHSLQTSLVWRRYSSVHTQASFTWSKSIDDDSSTFARTDAANSIGIPVDGVAGFNRGLSNHDVRRHLNLHMLWDLPRTRFWAAPALNGWRVGGLLTAGSGLPFSATLAYDAARTGTSRPDYRGGQRPDANPAFTGSVITGDPLRWFRTEAFLRPQPGYLGNLGRNTLTGPAWFSADLNLVREFAFARTDGPRLSFRLEAFNLTNHTNLSLPSQQRSQVFTASGTIADAGRITAAGPARKFQLGLRLDF